jgi:hypothetical protein
VEKKVYSDAKKVVLPVVGAVKEERQSTVVMLIF